MKSVVRRSVQRLTIRRGTATVLSFVASCILLPASAQAGNPITRLAAGPIAPTTHCNPNLTAEDFVTTAGARTDYCMAYYVDGGDPVKGDDTKQTIVDNHEGFLATADTTPQCKLADYMPDRGEPARCPANTQTGSGQALVRVSVGGIVIPQTVPVKMWNLEHAPDSVAGASASSSPRTSAASSSRTRSSPPTSDCAPTPTWACAR